MNRLKLDWSLSSHEERTAFLNRYINDDKFSKIPLTNDELETMANYLLWGKDENGLNPEQKKELELPRKSDNWTKSASDKIKSLDELMETPTWNENEVIQDGHPQTKFPRQVFSREEARKKAPKPILEALEELWHNIDRTEYRIGQYELAHGKRTKPLRQELIDALNEDERLTMELSAPAMPQYQYLKLRHQLVEMRQEQYTLKDSYAPTLQQETIDTPEKIVDATFGDEIKVFPLDLLERHSQLFVPLSQINSQTFNSEEQKAASKLIWAQEDFHKQVNLSLNLSGGGLLYFDFEDPEHVYNLIDQYAAIQDDADFSKFVHIEKSTLSKTLNFYIEQSDLSGAQHELLLLKLKKMKNQDIAAAVNVKYGKSYTANYISTIFRQKIIPAINSAAAMHRILLENIFFPDEWKKCTNCGHIYLRNTQYFVKKTKSKDGLSNKCKICDKAEREFYKATARKWAEEEQDG